MKTQKSQVSIYLRHWRPDEFELGELVETVIDGNTNELLLNHVKLFMKLSISYFKISLCLSRSQRLLASTWKIWSCTSANRTTRTE